MERLGFTPEARAAYENAATLEKPARGVAAWRRANELRRGDALAASIAATRSITVTAFPEARTVLKEYLEARERTHGRLQWYGASAVKKRLEIAAEVHASDLSHRALLPRVFSRVAEVLSPRGQSDLYMQRYLIAGGLHRARRSGEATALLRALDADVIRTRGEAGWTAQAACEEAIEMIVRGSPVKTLNFLRDAFHGSTAKGESRLAALYANLAGQDRAHLLQSGLSDDDIGYTDATVALGRREHAPHAGSSTVPYSTSSTSVAMSAATISLSLADLRTPLEKRNALLLPAPPSSNTRRFGITSARSSFAETTWSSSISWPAPRM